MIGKGGWYRGNKRRVTFMPAMGTHEKPKTLYFLSIQKN